MNRERKYKLSINWKLKDCSNEKEGEGKGGREIKNTTRWNKGSEMVSWFCCGRFWSSFLRGSNVSFTKSNSDSHY
jgi:hypothetical protein